MMFEGYSADTRAGKFPLVSMGGRAEGLACADPGARTPSALAEILQYVFRSWNEKSGTNLCPIVSNNQLSNLRHHVSLANFFKYSFNVKHVETHLNVGILKKNV